MTFIKQLKDHIGGLVRIKTALFWYDTRSHDGIEGRVCLLLDATTQHRDPSAVAPGSLCATTDTVNSRAENLAYALFLIDGSPKWILTSKKDVELLK
jgi:hypothetical protein